MTYIHTYIYTHTHTHIAFKDASSVLSRGIDAQLLKGKFPFCYIRLVDGLLLIDGYA